MDAEAMDVDVVWAAGNETTGSASMDGAMTSDAWRDDASMSRVLTDRVDCRKWNDRHCEYGRCDDERCTERRGGKGRCT